MPKDHPATDAAPTALAVIPCLNEEQHLETIVRQLARASQDLRLRIVIADGGSTDQSRTIAQALTQEYANVHWLQNPQKIQSAAVNRAVATYGTDTTYIIRVDAHADYPDDYCQQLVQEAEATQAASVVVAMHTAGRARLQNIIATTQNSKLGNGGSAHRMHEESGKWVEHGHHALIRTQAFVAVGGYDEAFTANEDAELDVRLRRRGFPIWLTRKTALTYYPRPHLPPLFRQYSRYGSGRAQNLLKHRTGMKLRQLLPVAVVPALLLASVAPWFWPAALPALLWAAVCLGYGFLLSIKTRAPLTLLSGPVAMLMHLAWSWGFWEHMARRLFVLRREQHHA